MNKRVSLGGSGGSGNVSEWFVGQWIVGVISFQKIFGLCGLKGHKVEIMWDVTLVHGRTMECGERARILKQNSQNEKIQIFGKYLDFWEIFRFLELENCDLILDT